MIEQMLKVSDIANLYDCSKDTVYRMIQNKQIQAVDICNSIRVYKKDFYGLEKTDIINKEYVTIKDASKLLNIGREKLTNLINEQYENDNFYLCKKQINKRYKLNTRQIALYLSQNTIS